MPFDSVELEPLRVSLNKQHVSTNTIPKYIAQMSSEHIPWQRAWHMSTRVKTEGRISAVSLKDLSSHFLKRKNLIYLFIYLCLFLYLSILTFSRDFSVDNATSYLLLRGSNPVRGKRLFSLTNVQTISGAHPASCWMVPGYKVVPAGS
jgi:hypothetical protein